MTNAPTSRKTHVIRILGTNKNKEILRDIWADVERIDEATSRDKGTPGFRQKVVRKFRWRDDPTDTEEYLDPELEDQFPDQFKRKTVLVKVCSPDEKDLNDPEEWIPIRAIKRIKSRRNSQKHNARQQQYENLINSDIQQSRTVEPRRIVHYDTNIDSKADKAFDDDPTLKVYVVKGKLYTKLDGSAGAAEFADADNKDTKDKDQYVEHEIATKLHHRGNNVYNGSGNEPSDTGPKGRQKRVTRMRNQYMIDESDPAKLKELGLNDINPPYRLDPFQNIVNVQLKPTEEVLLATSVSNANGESQVTEDGVTFTDGFGKVACAASGLGKTIAVTEGEIVFGKPRDGDACFIKIKSTTIERGILDEAGNLQWSTVQTVTDDSKTVNLSFAGKAFFVSANDGDSKAFLYVSFDGEKWRKVATATNPNGGEEGENGEPDGNHVAYNPDNEVYCHTGTFIRAYQFDIVDTDDGRIHESHAAHTNFWSATSRDGVHWSPVYEMTKFQAGSGTAGSPGLGGASATLKSISFGAGIFVAATSYRIQYDYFNFMGFLNVIQHIINPIESCGYATSTDGVSWSNHQLPGAEWDPGFAVFDEHGDGSNNRGPLHGFSRGIIWCKTGGTDPKTKKPKGFFLSIGYEESVGFGDGPGGFVSKTANVKRWMSSDGSSWSMTYSKSNVFPDPFHRKIDNHLSVHKKKADPDKVIKI